LLVSIPAGLGPDDVADGECDKGSKFHADIVAWLGLSAHV
jgi:hypothetical protein